MDFTLWALKSPRWHRCTVHMWELVNVMILRIAALPCDSSHLVGFIACDTVVSFRASYHCRASNNLHACRSGMSNSEQEKMCRWTKLYCGCDIRFCTNEIFRKVLLINVVNSGIEYSVSVCVGLLWGPCTPSSSYTYANICPPQQGVSAVSAVAVGSLGSRP